MCCDSIDWLDDEDDGDNAVKEEKDDGGENKNDDNESQSLNVMLCYCFLLPLGGDSHYHHGTKIIG